jgi:hypothetical protein
LGTKEANKSTGEKKEAGELKSNTKYKETWGHLHFWVICAIALLMKKGKRKGLFNTSFLW